MDHIDTDTKTGTAIIAGTNLPSMFTPNGQAALLFILTSSIAPLIHLSYRKMMVRCPVCVCVCMCVCVCVCARASVCWCVLVYMYRRTLTLTNDA